MALQKIIIVSEDGSKQIFEMILKSDPTDSEDKGNGIMSRRDPAGSSGIANRLDSAL